MEGRGQTDELGTKVFHVDLPRLVGGVDGGGLAPLVYEVPEMRFRTIILGHGRDPLEGEGQSEELPEMPELREKVLAPDLQERGSTPMK